MDWEVKFETSPYKIYYRQISIFRSELVELGSLIDRLEREGEHVVSIIPNIVATETGLLLTRASGMNGLAIITRKS
jgi:hypothetical protein